ncbi:hypothetical protein [Escherichia coli]|uniref:hypothetical protein n=1 Tax=Escherichia coli TaxID=562 RepID=UPI0020B65079|nr:hypothetical protein [Escherichia coli]
MASMLENIDFDEKKVFPVFLNQYKNNGEWLPLTPFTLLINDPTISMILSKGINNSLFLMLDEYKKLL